MKILVEHDLPRRLRFARVYMEAGTASVFFSLDGTTANWYASIGKKKGRLGMSDKEYSRLRASVPAVQTLDDNGEVVIVKNNKGYEEEWVKPQWVLTSVRKHKDDGEESVGLAVSP